MADICDRCAANTSEDATKTTEIGANGLPELIRGQRFIFDFNARNIDENRSIELFSYIPEFSYIRKNTHIHNIGLDTSSFVTLLNPTLLNTFEVNDKSF